MGEGENEEFLLKNVLSFLTNDIWFFVQPVFSPIYDTNSSPIKNQAHLTWLTHSPPPLFTSFPKLVKREPIAIITNVTPSFHLEPILLIKPIRNKIKILSHPHIVYNPP